MTDPTPAPDAPPTPPAELPDAVDRAIARAYEARVRLAIYGGNSELDAHSDADTYLRRAIASALADAHAAGYSAALDDVAAEVAQMGGGR